MAVYVPRFQSKVIPGLVMWANGAVVRVSLDEHGNIKRVGKIEATKRVEVLESIGRISIDDKDLALKVFRTIETHLSNRIER
jgi:hypothetical protein